jgi:hypothetical protein
VGGGDKSGGAKDGTPRPTSPNNSAKAAPPREGKYANLANAAKAASAINPSTFSQPQFTNNGLPPMPGAPVEVVMPTILRGGDSLTQSYDDVPSIRNSGVANAGRSKATENYHESLESMNLMSTLNLFIIH